MLGAIFESEIREQPAVLRRCAETAHARRIDDELGDSPALFVGSGSSFFVAQLAALAWRRAGRFAAALAASEAAFDARAHDDAVVVALSQSGRTGDVLDARTALHPMAIVAITNDATSALATSASTVIALDAGAERAVPASKSVTSMAATLLWAAARRDGDDDAIASELIAAAEALGAWLEGDALPSMDRAAAMLEAAQSTIVIGSGYGVPVASEIALKIKESTYRHAEGVGAGEFRHGSTAILDPSRALVGVVDDWSRAPVGTVIGVGRAAGSVAFTIGGALPDSAAFGPHISGRFAPLGWIAAGQVLALSLARRLGVESDAPRGLQKFLA